MVFVLGSPLLRSRLGGHSARPSVEAHMVVHGDIVNNRAIHVRIVNHRRIDVHDGRVVRKHSAIPASADEANPAVAEPIIDPSIETDVRSPIAGVKKVSPAAPTPIPGRPEQSHGWSHNPRSRHPVIPIRAIRPVAGRPEVACSWTDGLLVNRQRRRADVYGNANTNLCGRPRWHENHYQRKQNQSKNAASAHLWLSSVD